MDAFMLAQMIASGEGFATSCALVGFLARVTSVMPGQFIRA
jgi:hypothetical protein